MIAFTPTRADQARKTTLALFAAQEKKNRLEIRESAKWDLSNC